MAADQQITEVVDFNPPRPIKRGAVAPFVDMAALPENQRDIAYVSEREFSGGGSRFQNGDTLFARITPCLENGKTAKVNSLPAGSIAHGSTEFIVMAAKAPEYDEDYVYYLARHPDFRAFAEARMEGTSGRQRVSWQALSDFSFPFPSSDQRKVIGSILRKIDDKIDLNRRINQTLEAMAQAIFKSWFVDFDPVKAEIAAVDQGEDPLRAAMRAISGKTDAELDQMPREHHDQLAATAALFPDAMEESELGEIPKGWEAKTADSLTEVGIGKTPPRKEPQWFTEGEGDWRWVSIKDMASSGVFQQRSSELLTSEAVSRFNVRVVPDRTVLLSFKLTIGRVAITDGPMVTNEAIAHFKLPDDSVISSEYLYLYLKRFDYSMLGSTSSIADAVNSKTIREIPIVVASRSLIDEFTRSISPLFMEIKNRQNEITSLCTTRDVLLPKLLSGEIEVSP